MRAALLLLSALPFLASCGTVHDWQELETAPMTYGDCYEGLLFIAKNDGFTVDVNGTDRGMGTLQSKWRMRQLSLGRPGRYRLVAEIDVDKGSAQTGWLVRFAIEQQLVKDLRRSTQPEEEDWSKNGQDGEREAIFGEKLQRRIGKPLTPATPPRTPPRT